MYVHFLSSENSQALTVVGGEGGVGWEKGSNATLLNRILYDQSSASGMHSQTLDTMRQKLAEMEGTLAREQQAHKHYQVCLAAAVHTDKHYQVCLAAAVHTDKHYQVHLAAAVHTHKHY